MEEYHKIQTVFLRNPGDKFRTLLEGEWSKPEFEYLKDNQWEFTEKVDGTNIIIDWQCGDGDISCCRKFWGKTKNAQIPTYLYHRLEELFPMDKFKTLYPDTSFTLYGEGYGAKIQKGGGNYIPDGVDFILFDVLCSGLWLMRESVMDISKKLGIKTVPLLGRGTLLYMVRMVKGRLFPSLLQTLPEGIVARPVVELVNRSGERIITKLKLTDFGEIEPCHSQLKK